MGRNLFVLLLMTWTLTFTVQLLSALGGRATALTWVLMVVAAGGFVVTLTMRARSRRAETTN